MFSPILFLILPRQEEMWSIVDTWCCDMWSYCDNKWRKSGRDKYDIIKVYRLDARKVTNGI